MDNRDFIKWAQRYSLNDENQMSKDELGMWVEYAYYSYVQNELAHLKSENLLIREESDRHFGLWVESQAENARLKAEVERLTEVIKAQAKGLDEKFGREGGQPSLSDSPTWQAIGAYAELKEDYARLKAEADQMATILSDLLQSDFIACSISRGVIKSTLNKWNAAPK
jgi:hypothetical protein